MKVNLWGCEIINGTGKEKTKVQTCRFVYILGLFSNFIIFFVIGILVSFTSLGL